jgi:aminopeptidase N
MMATMLGKEKFKKAMDLYFETFDGQAVTTRDFVWAMSTGGERDLTQFEETWYHQPRTPMIRVEENYVSEAWELHLTIIQEQQTDTEGNTLKPWYFPLGIGIFSSETHTEYPLSVTDNEQDLLTRGMLIVSQERETFTFTGIDTAPILSINRGFTAPVKVMSKNRHSLFLMQHETNNIARYEANQTSARENIEHILTWSTTDPSYIDAYLGILEESLSDELFHSLLINIPSTESLIPEFSWCDPLRLYAARVALFSAIKKDSTAIIEKIHTELIQEVESYLKHSEGISDGQIAKRAKIVSLTHILTELGEDTTKLCHLLLMSQTMTLKLSAWKNLLVIDPTRYLKDLENWMHEHDYFSDLLMKMKYFSLISRIESPEAIKIIQKTLESEHFDYKIPNLIRTLIWGFGKNTLLFHREDGSGYDFFIEQLRKIDTINPQISARMSKLFSQTNLLDSSFQKRIQERIQKFLQTPSLSSEAREVLEKII